MEKIKNILKELNEFGISKSNINDILNPNEIEFYNKLEVFYNNSLKDQNVKQKINEISNGNVDSNGKQKSYEITHDVYLKSPLSFDNIPLIQLYLSKNILKIAKEYLGPAIKLRNPLAWIHPATNQKKEIRSQKWHRDQEDYKMLKVFILFSDVNNKNGPTNYVKSTKFGSKFGNVAPNMIWAKNHWSKHNKILGKIYNKTREIFPFNYPIPSKNIVKATGKMGTIYFLDTNGLHKGGFVQEGIRLMTHCNFLRSESPMLNKGQILEKLNSDEKLFSFDYNSETFKSFDSDIQKILI